MPTQQQRELKADGSRLRHTCWPRYGRKNIFRVLSAAVDVAVAVDVTVAVTVAVPVFVAVKVAESGP